MPAFPRSEAVIGNPTAFPDRVPVHEEGEEEENGEVSRHIGDGRPGRHRAYVAQRKRVVKERKSSRIELCWR